MYVHGLFEKRGKYIFRKEAFIQWGGKKEVIGSIILLNPGKAKLEKNLWEDLKKGKVKVAEGKITRDLGKIYLIEKVMNKVFSPLEGRLLIYNLFNLVNSDPEIAIADFHSIKNNEEFFDVLYPNTKKLNNVPWIWLAWTTIEERIEELVERIEPNLISLPHKRIIGNLIGDPNWKFGYCIKAAYPPVENKKIDRLALIIKNQINDLKISSGE